jgi:hypothetical protein
LFTSQPVLTGPNILGDAMDDPLSYLGLTTVTICHTHSNGVDILIKRPYKSTLYYQHVTCSSYKRVEHLSRSGSVELVPVSNTGNEAYYLFYWQKRFPIDPEYHTFQDLDHDRAPGLVAG